MDSRRYKADDTLQGALDALEDTYAQANRTIAEQAEVIAKLREALDTIAGVIALAEAS